MTEILTRLLPAARDLRNPLAVGYAWIIIVWALVNTHVSSSEVEDRFAETVGAVNEFWLLAGVTFLAVVLGSGIVRLMDRLMQLTRTRHGELYNPLDAPEPLRSESRSILPRATGDREYRSHLADYLDREGQTIAEGWTFPSDRPAVRAYELRLFRDVLSDDPEFGALQAEQLLRFSMLPPVLFASVASFAWAFGADDKGPLLLGVVLLAFGVILVFDYQRIGSLLIQRWHRLLRAYPDCLPPDVRARRQEYLDRAGETSAERDAPGPES